MRGRPVNAFEKYPKINDAYARMRSRFRDRLKIWEEENPDNKVSQENIPLMEFIRSCIPAHLNPPSLGSDSKNIRGRMREILYPFLEKGQIDPDHFAGWISDSERMATFLNEWLANKKPRRVSRPQPKPTIKDLMERRLIPPYSNLVLRFSGEVYTGSITANGGIEIDLGSGLKHFRSPNAVLDKGLSAKNRVAWNYFSLVNPDGSETLLAELKAEFLKIKDLT